MRSPVMTFVNARSALKLLYEHDNLTCRSLVVRWLLLRRFCLCTGTSISRKCSSTVAWNAAFFSVGRPMRVKSLCDQLSESISYVYANLVSYFEENIMTSRRKTYNQMRLTYWRTTTWNISPRPEHCSEQASRQRLSHHRRLCTVGNQSERLQIRLGSWYCR